MQEIQLSTAVAQIDEGTNKLKKQSFSKAKFIVFLYIFVTEMVDNDMYATGPVVREKPGEEGSYFIKASD